MSVRTDEAWIAAGERLRRAHEAAIARYPKVCPACSSDEITPMFEPGRHLWECSDCSWIFEVTP